MYILPIIIYSTYNECVFSTSILYLQYAVTFPLSGACTCVFVSSDCLEKCTLVPLLYQIARQREEEAAEQQRRQQQEANDRWFHRFIGRPQEEPVSGPLPLPVPACNACLFGIQGQRAANPPRPNIGVALAGLAREPAG